MDLCFGLPCGRIGAGSNLGSSAAVATSEREGIREVNMTNQELNRKLAEWAGFTESDIKRHYYFEIGGGKRAKWREPSTEWHIKLPTFAQSLDACFKWLVPKAIDRIMAEQECGRNVAYAILFKKWFAELELNMAQPALALCLAIRQCPKAFTAGIGRSTR